VVHGSKEIWETTEVGADVELDRGERSWHRGKKPPKSGGTDAKFGGTFPSIYSIMLNCKVGAGKCACGLGPLGMVWGLAGRRF